MTRSELMSRIRSVSGMERRARPLATLAAGCRLRHQPKGVFGRPDYASKSRKVAVFVDGCWFHSCPRHFTMPKTNRPFWRRKFKRNVERRREVSAVLKGDGWKIMRIWEHEVARHYRLKKKS